MSFVPPREVGMFDAVQTAVNSMSNAAALDSPLTDQDGLSGVPVKD
jgi:hypothetical protein